MRENDAGAGRDRNEKIMRQADRRGDVEERHGDELYRLDKTYAPDYVINSGGLINVYGEIHHWSPDRAKTKAGEIYNTMLKIYEISGREGIPSYQAADRLAVERVKAVRGLKAMWLPGSK